MRHMMAAAALVLGACGQADEAAEGSGVGGACAGGKLPVTGVCRDASPALFLAIDSSLDTVARGCVWRTEELQTGEKEALLFRAQDCTGEMWDRIAYTWVGRYVKSRSVAVPEDQATFALEVFDVGDGETAEQVALKTLSAAPEGQRERCTTAPLNNVKAPGRVFELAPNAELEAELQASSPDEPWEACGPNGVAMDGVQYWEGRDRHALFHMIGQDQPMWDPASFTFYVKGADGRWSRSEEKPD